MNILSVRLVHCSGKIGFAAQKSYWVYHFQPEARMGSFDTRSAYFF